MVVNPEENQKDQTNDFEAQQNWDGFWNLLLQEDMRQNPKTYKKSNAEKENK